MGCLKLTERDYIQLHDYSTYNADGLPMSISDSQGRVKTYDRDKMGRIIKELFPNKTATAYQFTVTGQISKVLDRRNNPISFKWNKFGKVAQKKTAAGQFTDYVYDQYGLLESTVSRFKKKDAVDRAIKYTYNDLDRLTAIDYGKGQKKTLEYDSWGKLVKAVSTNGDIRRTVFNKYDEFDRVVKSIETVFTKDKVQSAVKRTYAYSPYGKRTRLTVCTNGLMGGKMVKSDVLRTKWEFNKFGQLAKITKGKDVVEYLYDKHGKVLKRTANNMEQYYTYTPLNQLETKSLGALFGKSPIASLKYVYATDGSINARIVNGVKQSYQYDQMGQLTAVLDASGAKVEQYTYDNAGNILKKDIGGKVTTYTYDKANQLVSSTSTVNSQFSTVNYQYDAAGRMVKEGAKSYAYGWLDKVMNITENGKVTNSYSYSMDGQLSAVNESGKQESFIWDGLALLKRGSTEYVYEPAVTGGNPILANGNALFNDMLGTTLGKYDGKKFIDNQSTSFGSGDKSAFFTGKPHVAGLGYAFLFRNYRSDLSKWQTSDPLGYPDGWNNFAYVNNHVASSYDCLGGAEGYYYSNGGNYYYSDDNNYFVGGSAQSQINNLTDALAHYRSGAEGTVAAGSGLYSEMAANSTYQNRIVGNNSVLASIIKAKLASVSLSQSSGTLSNSSGAYIGGLECSTLGSYALNVAYSTAWGSTAWQWDASVGKYYRDVYTGQFSVNLSGSDGWNFDWNASYNLWQNITRELIPGWIAGATGNPANFTISYSTSTTYLLSARQYE